MAALREHSNRFYGSYSFDDIGLYRGAIDGWNGMERCDWSVSGPHTPS
jgi:hypothetical protein